jgi:hypothetical protein
VGRLELRLLEKHLLPKDQMKTILKMSFARSLRADQWEQMVEVDAAGDLLEQSCASVWLFQLR